MSWFGYTNPDILSRHQKEIKDEYYKVGYTVPWLQKMEIFQLARQYSSVQQSDLHHTDEVAASTHPLAPCQSLI